MLSVKKCKILMFSVIKQITVKCYNNNLTQQKCPGGGNNARNKDLDSLN